MEDLYSPKTLRGVIRNTKPPKRFFVTRFFANQVLFPTKTVSFEFQDDKRRLAPYVNPRLGGEVISRDGYDVKTFEAPYIEPMRVITDDTLAQKLLGESPYNSGYTPADRAVEIAARDILELQDAIYRREEFMCARLKQDGKLTVKGQGVNAVVDYEFTNIINTSVSDKWTEDYDICGKLIEVSQLLARDGITAGLVILGSDAAAALLRNKKFLKLMDLQRVNMGEINPNELENGASYIGRLLLPGANLELVQYSEWYLDTDGINKPLIDPESVIVQSAREQNSMLYGAVTILNNQGEYETYMEAYTPRTWFTQNPAAKFISIVSRPLPMPHDIKSWYVLKGVVSGV